MRLRLTIGTCAAVISTVFLAAGCSFVTVKQDPFPPLEISAERPAPPPSRVVLTNSSIKIKDKVQFEVGSATLLESSFALLNEVAGILKENPQIELVQIEGHTDSTGGLRTNKKLSQARAESVRDYFVKQGLEEARFKAKGFGPEKPIADNESEEGREQNRRVEFNILKQGPKKTVVPGDQG